MTTQCFEPPMPGLHRARRGRGLAGTVAVVVLGAAASAAHAEWPPNGGIGFGGGLTITTPVGPDGPALRETTIGISVDATAPVYAHDGAYSGRGHVFAELSSSVWLLPLVTGDVRRAFEPMTLRVGFNSSLKYAPSALYGDPGFGLDNRAEAVLPLDGSTPDFQLHSELGIEADDLGAHWLRFRFPLLDYRYSVGSGSSSRLLGVELNLGSAGKLPCTLGQACEFDQGYWSFSVQTVPEPATASLGLAGGLLLWGLARRRRVAGPA